MCLMLSFVADHRYKNPLFISMLLTQLQNVSVTQPAQ